MHIILYSFHHIAINRRSSIATSQPTKELRIWQKKGITHDRAGGALTGSTPRTTVHAGLAYGGSGKLNRTNPLLIQTK